MGGLVCVPGPTSAVAPYDSCQAFSFRTFDTLFKILKFGGVETLLTTTPTGPLILIQRAHLFVRQGAYFLNGMNV